MMYANSIPDVKTLELVLRQYCVQTMVDEDEFALGNVKLTMQYRLEWMAYQLMGTLNLPCKVLQDDKEIARFPASRKDMFLVSIGLSRWAKFTSLRANEYITFPKYEFPKSMGSARIVYTTHKSPA
jgi:hypothetical protein